MEFKSISGKPLSFRSLGEHIAMDGVCESRVFDAPTARAMAHELLRLAGEEAPERFVVSYTREEMIAMKQALEDPGAIGPAVRRLFEAMLDGITRALEEK